MQSSPATSRSIASLSLDLDNKWSYLKTHGDAAWQQFPSYLDLVVPRVLDELARRRLKITFFIVGQDAALPQNQPALAAIAAAGHEIGNHSFHHEPWLHLYTSEQLTEELAETEEHLWQATGQRPVGFRGPGFSTSPELLRLLACRGYEYDASTLPSFLGPLARMYYFCTARLSAAERQKRKQLFGAMSEGFKPLRPHFLDFGDKRLVELPVTTMPLARVPIHVSYLLFLLRYSRAAALAYFRLALGLCRLRGVELSILLHPLDFLGCDDEPDLGFFPAMDLASAAKLELVGQVLDLLATRFQVVTMREHAAAAAGRPLIVRPMSSSPAGLEKAECGMHR